MNFLVFIMNWALELYIFWRFLRHLGTRAVSLIAAAKEAHCSIRSSRWENEGGERFYDQGSADWWDKITKHVLQWKHNCATYSKILNVFVAEYDFPKRPEEELRQLSFFSKDSPMDNCRVVWAIELWDLFCFLKKESLPLLQSFDKDNKMNLTA